MEDDLGPYPYFGKAPHGWVRMDSIPIDGCFYGRFMDDPWDFPSFFSCTPIEIIVGESSTRLDDIWMIYRVPPFLLKETSKFGD